jgi:hypothetical protein
MAKRETPVHQPKSRSLKVIFVILRCHGRKQDEESQEEQKHRETQVIHFSKSHAFLKRQYLVSVRGEGKILRSLRLRTSEIGKM